MTPNEQAVAAVLATYEDALNAPDTEAVMPLYTDDGVFMPPYSQPAIGARRQCAKPMTRCSKVIMLSVKFNITEIVEMSQTGCSRGLIRQERQQTTRPVRRVQKQIRNSLSLRRARTAPGKLHVIASPRRTHQNDKWKRRLWRKASRL